MLRSCGDALRVTFAIAWPRTDRHVCSPRLTIAFTCRRFWPETAIWRVVGRMKGSADSSKDRAIAT